MQSMLEVCNISVEDLIKLFKSLKTIQAVADHLGISRRTVNKYATKLGVSLPAHRPVSTGRPRMTSGYSKIVNWIKENPDKKLPAKTKDIARIVGVSAGAVYQYVSYRKFKMQSYIEKLPKLSTLEGSISDINNRSMSLEKFTDYELKFDVRKWQVTIWAYFGQNRFKMTFIMPLKKFEDLYRIHSKDSRNNL